MKDELVGIVVAKLAKEKGFNEVCLDTFDNKDKPTNRYNIRTHEDMSNEEIQEEFEVKNSNLVEGYTARPTQSLLQRWLREICKIHIEIIPTGNKWHCVMYPIVVINDVGHFEDWETYEEALEEGLLQGLQLTN